MKRLRGEQGPGRIRQALGTARQRLRLRQRNGRTGKGNAARGASGRAKVKGASQARLRCRETSRRERKGRASWEHVWAQVDKRRRQGTVIDEKGQWLGVAARKGEGQEEEAG